MAKSIPDAVALLKQDHRKLEALFEQFEKARNPMRKEKVVKQICTELMIHSMIEEEIFYPACKGQLEDEDVLEEAYVEHDGAKVLISELLKGDPDNEFYDAKVMVLSEMIKHHVKEEEKRSEGLLALAKAADLDMDGLGELMMQRKEQLIQQFVGGELPDPQTRSYTGHKLVQRTPLTS